MKYTNKFFYPFGIFLLAFLTYSNTLSHQYTQDDAIVIYDNMYTQQGLQGIPGLLSKDTFFGFFKEEGKQNLVSGGRYRPLTPVMFAIEYQFFKDKPFYGHLFNAFWFGLLCMVIYFFTDRLLQVKYNNSSLIALITALFFAIHPIHTEAVANIKGRDEIMALLLSLFAAHLVLNKPLKNNNLTYVLAFISFFLACLSKENSITFLAVVPLASYLFGDKSNKNVFPNTIPLLLAAVLFVFVRSSIIGLSAGTPPLELMNNPYLKIVGNEYVAFTFGEKYGTIALSLLKYLGLLILPIHQTNDYYPYQLDITRLSDLSSLLSIIIHSLLIGITFKLFKSRPIVTFGIAFYFITLSIVSNVFFPIGTNMSERFLFIPSYGYCLLVGYAISLIFDNNKVLAIAFTTLLAATYLLLTINRNKVWQDDYTLFTTDVKVSSNSAKALNAAGGALITKFANSDDIPLKENKLKLASSYLQKAINIHPNYKNAHLLLGNALYYLNDLDGAILSYQNVLKLDNNSADGSKNLAVALRDRGRIAGEQEQNLSKATELLNRSYQLNPTDIETIRLLGVSYGIAGEHQQAITFFKKVTELTPNHAPSYLNLSNAYKYAGDLHNAELILQKALALDPNILNQ